MPATGAAGGSGGFALALLTESFAVRALLGSLAAAALAAVAVRAGFAASVSSRRLLVLAPPLAAAAAAVATALHSAAYLPELLVLPGSWAGELNDLVSALAFEDRPRNLLLVVHAAVAGTLLLRRVLGLYSLRRILARGRVPGRDDRRVVDTLAGLAPRVGVRVPRLVLIPDCPGGAFAAGILRPVLGADPALIRTLDDGELEGLLAHELAHVRRRDALLSLAVGMFRDVTFFLPPVSMAARWLRREQEESADEIAARATRRPAALASGILKVWQRSRVAGPRAACAAVPPRPAMAGAPRMGALALSDGSRLMALRVERLIVGHRALSRRRSNAEMALAAAVLSVGLVGALTVPGWIVERTDSAQIWVPILTSGGTTTTVQRQESPAFASFRALTATPAAVPDAAVPAAPDATGAGCPCVETQAQLRASVGATAPTSTRRLEWVSGQRDFDIREVPQARAVLTLDQGPRMGVFLVPEGAGGP